MPATYAHYRMGEQVRRMVNSEISDMIKRNYQLYRIGLHGPDILFYYKPWGSNPVNQIGHQLHEISGEEFFSHASKVVKEHAGDERYLVYTYGVLCHFALDQACHGYVDHTVEIKGISHTRIEEEFDRYLLEMDGKDGVGHLTSEHIAARKEFADVITAFYPGADKTQVLDSLRGMILIHKLFLCKSNVKRQLIYTILRLLHIYDSTKDHIRRAKADPACEESNHILHKLYRKGRKHALAFMESYDLNIPFPEDLQDYMNYNFSSVRVAGGQIREK